MEIDIDKFKKAIGANAEDDFDYNELCNNIRVNEDGSIESMGGGLFVLLSPDYELIDLVGGVSLETTQSLMSEEKECVTDE
jgi:hypothetical protein